MRSNATSFYNYLWWYKKLFASFLFETKKWKSKKNNVFWEIRQFKYYPCEYSCKQEIFFVLEKLTKQNQGLLINTSFKGW